MENSNYLDILVNQIHSVVVATVGEDGLPATRVIDLMIYDDDGIYFLTAKGKQFYTHLTKNKYISLTGMIGGGNSLSKKAITLSGSVKCIGSDKIDEIFEKNSYMEEIYRTKESCMALEVFVINRAQGEFFDLTTKPITRGSFSVGTPESKSSGYFITSSCTGCGKCIDSCPVGCITQTPIFSIIQKNCLHCGNCYQVCPEHAVHSEVRNEK